MENLIPLFFILYMLGTVVSAIVQKRRGDAARGGAPPVSRPVPPARRPDAPAPTAPEGAEPAGPPSAEEVRDEPEERPPVPDIFWPFPFEPVSGPAGAPASAPQPQESLPEPELQRAPSAEPAAAPQAALRELQERSAEESPHVPSPPPVPEMPRKVSRAAAPLMPRAAALRPGELYLGGGEIGRAILLSEILGPPRALRPYEPPALRRPGARPQLPRSDRASGTAR